MTVDLRDDNITEFKQQVLEYALIRFNTLLRFEEEYQQEKLKYIDIENAVCLFYNVSFTDLRGESRKGPVKQARHMLVFLLTEEGYSLPWIGEKINRDHTTALYARDTMKEKINKYKESRNAYNELVKILNRKRRPK